MFGSAMDSVLADTPIPVKVDATARATQSKSIAVPLRFADKMDVTVAPPPDAIAVAAIAVDGHAHYHGPMPESGIAAVSSTAAMSTPPVVSSMELASKESAHPQQQSSDVVYAENVYVPTR